MDDLQKKMNVPNYDTKVPENVRSENSKKLSAYDMETQENIKSQTILTQFL